MHELGDNPRNEPGSTEGAQTPFASMRRRRSNRKNKGLWAATAVAVLLLGGGLAWFIMRDSEPDPPPVAETPSFAPEAEEDATVGPDVPPLDLPELSASDEFVRRLVAALSAHPQLASWLVTDELVERFVGAVVSLAGGSSPAEHVEFLVPEEDFHVRVVDGRTVMDPEGHRRYDLLTETFASLDTDGTAQLYHQLHPLFEEAYAELGIPDQTFDDAMERAVANLLAVEVVDRPLEVEPVEGVYEFRDPALENRAAAEKHLIRMGETNASRVQVKLRELAEAIGISDPDTP